MYTIIHVPKPNRSTYAVFMLSIRLAAVVWKLKVQMWFSSSTNAASELQLLKNNGL